MRARTAPARLTVALIVALLSARTARAETPSLKVCLAIPPPQTCANHSIESIEWEGLEGTRREVVERELLFAAGGIASESQIEEGARRLRNTGLFRTVSWRWEGPGRLVYVLDERWTLSPYFSLTDGGGLTQLTLGIGDVNALGRFIEYGIIASRLAERDRFFDAGGHAGDSLLLWVRDPRLFARSRTSLALTAGSVARGRRLYTDAGEIEGGFARRRATVSVAASREIRRWLRAGAYATFLHDTFSSRFVPSEVIAIQRQNFGGPPPSTTQPIVGIEARLGLIDLDDFYEIGWLATARAEHAEPGWGASERISALGLTARAYKRIPWRSQIAARLLAGVTSAEAVQFLEYIGGFDRVRGYVDSRFRGRSSWSANFEYRLAPIAHPWLTLQAVAFLDAGSAGAVSDAFGGLDAASIGAGGRLIIPKIYGFIGRLDLALPLLNARNDYGVSFGAQQFF